MRQLFLVLFSIGIFLNLNVQQPIKVYLLGTFHYGATSDKNSTKFDDLFSEKRQHELDEIAKAIVQHKVDKIFIEWSWDKQAKLDSAFNKYKSGQTTDTVELRDEIIQIAFRAAKMDNNIQLITADFKQELPYDAMNEYEKIHAKDSTASYPFFDIEYPFTKKTKKLNEMTLPDYYIQLNSVYKRQQNQFDYTHYSLSYGKDSDFVGAEFTASWYDRNIKIFTNILRNINMKHDKTILVLFGASHTNTIRSFFELHPLFKIEEIDELFSQQTILQ